MKFYELTYLISPDLSEKELKAVQEKINSFILEEEGVLIETNSVVKKSLAYPIKKKSSAFLAIVSFKLNPEKLINLEKKLKLEKAILRYILLAKKLPKEIPVVLKKPEKIIPKPEPKVELKEIEKKLEEILGE